jgi:hypothetical protein
MYTSRNRGWSRQSPFGAEMLFEESKRVGAANGFGELPRADVERIAIRGVLRPVREAAP